jgi:signal transduction histidine kinase
MNDVVAQMRPLADSKSLRIEVDVVPSMVNGDAGELRRAFVNLFANAVQWSQDGGLITIASRIESGMVRVRFSDEGFGVPEHLRARLFMRFAGDQQHGAGTGLGLYIVRRIAESHGGRVRYDPNQPRGSVFTIDLPELVSASVAQAR